MKNISQSVSVLHHSSAYKSICKCPPSQSYKSFKHIYFAASTSHKESELRAGSMNHLIRGTQTHDVTHTVNHDKNVLHTFGMNHRNTVLQDNIMSQWKHCTPYIWYES